MTDQSTEIEFKFYLRHLEDIRRRVLKNGGRMLAPRLLEHNLRFDTPERRLSQTGQVLRLRQDQDIHLTYKHPLPDEAARLELELKVDNLHIARALLEELGFQVTETYEKYRETFELDQVQIMLDALPYGCFTELEGPSIEAIKSVADRLGLDWEARMTISYLGLFNGLRQRLQLPFSDLTFANFAQRPPVKPEELGVRDAQLTPQAGEQ
jgi:adenylate cyclase class 2